MTIDVKTHFETIKKSLVSVDTKVGEMAVYKFDTGVSLAIRLYGEYCDAEVDVMSAFLKSDSVYVDIGTNVGYHALGVQQRTGCKVIGFEPHPNHFSVAAFNCQKNPILLYNTALGSKKGTFNITDFELETPDNYGEVRHDKKGEIVCSVEKLDTFKLSQCDLIKMDVEGQEMNVMKGATRTIKKFNPTIFYEAQENDVWPLCYDWLAERDYKQYWVVCRTKPLAPTYRTSEEDPFDTNGVCNILAVHSSRNQPINLLPVEPNETYDQAIHRIANYRLLF